ncbi:MAG TPA: hypothetical protein VFM14_04155 [Gemmatimonadales bacterium]|nr:hypothetical protein [Gemmatimonadales bacterium]
MTRFLVRLAWRVSAALLLVVPLGCKKKEAPPPAETSTTAPEPAPPAAPALMVIGVDLGNSIGPDKKVASPGGTFGRRDTIYASVSTVGAGSNANLAAKWTFQTGQVVDSSVQTISPTGPAQTEFHIARPSGWPVGKYTVEVFLNGVSTNTKQFEIKK